MKNINHRSLQETKLMTTDQLRENFLLTDLFVRDKVQLYYLQYDRVVVGGVMPTNSELEVKLSTELGAKFFLERRELGIINIGGSGTVFHDEGATDLKFRDGLYLPVGNKKVSFKSQDPNKPAKFYLFSTIGYVPYPVVKIDIAKAEPVAVGSLEQSNKRVINLYFHPNTCKTNQLLMGVTLLEPNNLWNTMPCHLHDNRFEGYLYFDLAPEEIVFHFMGEPTQTKHLVVQNEQFVISPNWSIHSGVGTGAYSFIWAMGGENLDYKDMKVVDKRSMR